MPLYGAYWTRGPRCGHRRPRGVRCETYIEDVTRRFATPGYHAVAPHFFHRAGGGTASYDDFAKVIPLYEHLNDDGILIDVDATREHLHAAGWDD